MIIALNKSGAEFVKRDSLNNLDDHFLFCGWDDYIKPNCSAAVSEGIILYKNMPDENDVNSSEILSGLRKNNSKIFKCQPFTELFHKFLVNQKRLTNKISSYLYSNLSIPSNLTYLDEYFDIYFIADLNEEDDFILLNGLLLSLQQVINQYLKSSHIRYFILSPEINHENLKNIEKAELLYSNLNLFYLIRKKMETRLGLYLFQEDATRDWNYVENSIRYSLPDIDKDTNGLAHLTTNIKLQYPEISEIEKALQHFHDIEIVDILYSETNQTASDMYDAKYYYFKFVEEGSSYFISSSIANSLKLICETDILSEYQKRFQEIATTTVESDKLFIDEIKASYIEGSVDINRLIDIRNEFERRLKGIGSNEISLENSELRRQFKNLTRIPQILKIIIPFVSRFIVSKKFLMPILSYNIKIALLRIYIKQLDQFLNILANVKNSAEQDISKYTFLDIKTEKMIREQIRDVFINYTGLTKIRNDFCKHEITKDYLDENTKLDLVSLVEGLIKNDILKNQFNPQETICPNWKAYSLPWSNNSDFMFYMSSNIYSNLFEKNSKEQSHKTINIKTFQQDVENSDNKNSEEKYFYNRIKKINSENDHRFAFVEYGAFPIESYLFKLVESDIKKLILSSEMLKEVIKTYSLQEIIDLYNVSEDMVCGQDQNEIEKFLMFIEMLNKDDVNELECKITTILDSISINRKSYKNILSLLSFLKSDNINDEHVLPDKINGMAS